MLLYGSELWPFSKVLLTRLHQLEGGFLRRMLRCRKGADEDFQRYMRRATRRARKIYLMYGRVLWEEQLLRRTHRMTGSTSGKLCAEDEAAGSTPRTWLSRALWMHAESAWRQEKRVRLAFRESAAVPRSYKRLWEEERATEDQWQHRHGCRKLVTWENALIAAYGEQWRKVASNWKEGEGDSVYQFLELCDLGGMKLRADRENLKRLLQQGMRMKSASGWSRSQPLSGISRAPSVFYWM